MMSADSGEYNAKLAYVHRFTRFVKWPKEGLKNEKFILGIAGKSPFGKTLEALVGSKTIKEKTIEVVEIEKKADIINMDLLFIPEKHSIELEDILAQTKNKNILTISEKKGYASKGTMINLKLQYGELKFEINKNVIDQEGFTVNSKLYQIADKVIK